MTSAERIDAILKERGMSRRQLALKAKIPPSSLQSAIERNKTISLEMQEKIAGALEVHVYELLGDDERLLFSTAEADVISNYLKQGYRFTNDEGILIRLYYAMNDDGQERAIEHVFELTQIPRYKAKSPPPDSPTDPPEDE